MPQDIDQKIPSKANWQDQVGIGLYVAGWLLFVLAVLAFFLVELGALGRTTKMLYFATHVFIGMGMLTGMMAFLFGKPHYLIVFFAHLALTMCMPCIEFA